MIFANSLALLEAEDKASGPLNRGHIADIPLMRTLLVICQKPQEPSFWELISSLFYWHKQVCNFKNLLQRLLACLNFTLDAKDLFS